MIRVYVFMVLVLMLAKPVFMLYNHANHPFTFGDVMQVMGHGITLDLSTALYLIIVPFLLTLFSIWLWSWNGIYRLLKVYYVLVAFVLALAFVSDTSLYEFWGFKLDASVLPYLSTPKEAFASVSVWYLLVRGLIIILLTFIFYKILVWLTPVQKERRRSISQIGYSRSRRQRGAFFISPVKPAGTRLLATVIGLLLIPLFVIGMRGGTSVSTSNVGQVYFSQDQFLNHSAVNPIFSFLSSFGKTATAVKTNNKKDEKGMYEYFSQKALKKQLKDIFDTQSVNPDTLLNTQRPNVLLIIMESCGSIFTEANGNGHVTPNLTKLMQEGVYFTSCVANSWRTDRGMVSILSGYPAFPDMSVMKMAQKCETMPSIARTLKDNDYSTTFLYGGDANFTNTRGYLLSTGFEKIISEDDFSKKERGDSK
ncbi:MAG: sulfatase-like hydrolase/transferase, partial [Prevotella sp.]|nr:sulfatase-like hydrolase/transferase [Prevotella sp.]